MAQRQTEKERIVFIVHSSLNNDVAMQVNEKLRSKGLRTIKQLFGVGKPIVDGIIQAMDTSDIVLIILTPEALESNWVTLEILLGLEKSKRSGRLCVRLVLYRVTEEQKNSLRDLKLIPSFTLDFNRDNWIDALVKTINEDIETSDDILPAGNVAHGLVFNYFIGFLKHVLPGLLQNVEGSDVYKEHGDRVLKKFLILLPASCKIKSMVGQFGEFVIEKIGDLEITSGQGDKTRKYNTPFYSITNSKKEIYYFLGECPTIMETMAKIADSNYVGEFDKRLQVVRFRHTLEDFVNHKNNIVYNDTVVFVVYNDEASDGKSHADEIWKAITDECQSVSTDELDVEVPERKLMLKVGIAEGKEKNMVTVTSIDVAEDQETAMELVDFLQKKNIQISNVEVTMSDQYMDKARWNIFVMSKHSMRYPKMLNQLERAFKDSKTDNQVQVLPVLTKGTGIEDIPKKYRWTLVLQSSDTDYLETLWKTMEGDDLKVDKVWPAGKIYEGLAWAYLLNYLPVNLCGRTTDGKEFQGRFKDAMVKFNTGCKCIARVFVLVPRTCKFPLPGPYFVGEKLLGAIEPAVIGFRKYFLQFYQITLENGETVCYAREYATPAVALYEMAHDFPAAGLSVEDMYEQSVEFAKYVTRIINEEGFKKDIGDITDKCTIVHFDDRNMDIQGMTDVLKNELSQCLAKGDFIAP